MGVPQEGRRASDQGYGDEDGSMDDVSFGNLIPSADVSDGIGANPTGVGPVRTRRFRSGTGDEALADEEDDRVGGGTQRRTRGRHLKNPVGRHNEGSHQVQNCALMLLYPLPFNFPSFLCVV